MITSKKNSHLKDIRRFRRRKGDVVLLEGPHLVGEALAAGGSLRSILATPEFLEGSAARLLLPRLPAPPLTIDARLLDEVTDSDSPRGIIALATLPRPTIEELPLVDNGIYLYAEGLQDPGNLGALVRTAEASGAAGLCLSPGSVHPGHSRALRASAGSLLRFPVATGGSLDALGAHLEPLRPTWLALHPSQGQDLYGDGLPLDGCLVLLVGAEGRGLSPSCRQRAHTELSVPLQSPVESLNTAVAAAVVLFELRRQRRRR